MAPSIVNKVCDKGLHPPIYKWALTMDKRQNCQGQLGLTADTQTFDIHNT